MDKIPDVVEKTLEVLANKFGTTVEHLWHIMVFYYIFWAYLEFGLCLILGFCFGFFAIFFTKKINILKAKNEKLHPYNWSSSDNDKQVGFTLGKWACISMSIIVVVITLSHGTLYLFNAEYYILRDIFSWLPSGLNK